MKIILIEDNPGDTVLIKKALSKANGNCEVHCACRLSEGMEELGKHAFDVVLSDLTLPDSQGLETVDRIIKQFPDIPLVALTSLANDAVALELLDQGVQDYLVKDQVTPESLQRSIRHAIQRQQIWTENRKLITRNQEARTELEMKNRRLAELYDTAHRFVDNVSHEF